MWVRPGVVHTVMIHVLSLFSYFRLASSWLALVVKNSIRVPLLAIGQTCSQSLESAAAAEGANYNALIRQPNYATPQCTHTNTAIYKRKRHWQKKFTISAVGHLSRDSRARRFLSFFSVAPFVPVKCLGTKGETTCPANWPLTAIMTLAHGTYRREGIYPGQNLISLTRPPTLCWPLSIFIIYCVYDGG